MMNDQKRGFKAKTIRSTIRNKLLSWSKSIDESQVEIKEIINNRVTVTGGAIASMLQGDLPNDYDCYFQSKEDATKVCQYYLNKFLEKHDDLHGTPTIKKTDTGIRIHLQSAGAAGEDVVNGDYQYFESMPQDAIEKYFHTKKFFSNKENKNRYTPEFFTDNAMTLSDGIQLVFRFTGDVETIHENFDFVHCTNYYRDGQVVLSPAAMEAILTKELRYVGSLFPVCSVFRLRKFLKRGWTITAGEIFKITYDISKLNLDDPRVLRDQLMGMDYAFFREVISILQKECLTKELDRTYLFELVDRVFDDVERRDEYEQ